MRSSNLLKLLSALFALALFATSCGSDGVVDTAADAVGDAADGAAEVVEDAADEVEDAADEVAEAVSDEPDDAMEEDTDDEEAEASAAVEGLLADNATFGNGAEEWEAAVRAGEANPTAADGEEISLFLVNLEGSPGGSFPEVREGLEIGIDYVNNVLGGVGGDPATGTAGRPLALESCSHTLDPAEAQACATESAASGSDIIVKGIDFFSPILWPVWGADQPVIDTLPIFVSDFTVPNSLAMGGGCVVAFPGAAQMMAEQLGHDKIAIIYSDNAPGQQCWQDTQERFYQYFTDQGIIEFRGFPEAPGDPSDNDAIVQEILNFLEGSNGAVHFGIAAADCAEYNDALDAAGNTFEVYNSGSCVDDAVQSAASATGKHFGFTGPPDPSNEALLSQFPEFWQWEVRHREQILIDGNPDSPLSSFMRLGFNTAVMAYQVTGDFIAEGGDPSDSAGLLEFMGSLDNQHRVGGSPLDCANKVADWAAICDFLQVYYTWNGSEFVKLDGLPGDPFDPTTWLNVAPLLEAVQEAVPRPAA